MLALAWAIAKSRLFLAGLPHFLVVTDHHPLVPILNNHRLDEIENPRLQRLKTRIIGYNFTAQWIKGTLNSAPDALSRNPVADPQPLELLAERDPNNEPEVTIAEIRTTSDTNHESLRLQDLRSAAHNDCTYDRLCHYILHGFLHSRNLLPEDCKCYWTVRDQLAIDNDRIVYGFCLLIPTRMHRDVLQQLHASHQGSVRTKQRAKLVVYWPGMDHDIDNVIMACRQRQDHLPSNPKEPITVKPRPSRPFQELAVDFCSYSGHDFLIIVDCHKNWPNIVHLGHDATASRLLSAMKQVFCRSGIPDVIWSDQGPQFTSRLFQAFASEWEFRHITSMPTYPQSNGKAEAAVKSMKKIIRATWSGTQLDSGKLAHALLQYRNTPSQRDGLSPSQKLFGRPMQDSLPAHGRSFAAEWQHSTEEANTQEKNHTKHVMQYYNQRAHLLPDICVGSHVTVQNEYTKVWDIYGTVIKIEPNRTYHIKTQRGHVLVRNRRFIRRRVPIIPPQPPGSVSTPSQRIQATPRHHTPPRRPPASPRNSQSHILRRSTRRRGRPQYFIEEHASK